MPAKSKSQQRLFGMVHAYQKGRLKHAPASVKRIAKHISNEDAKHFAKTRHDGLPEKAASLTRYEQGFLSKCAEYGLDTETSVALLEKRAALLPDLAGFGRSVIRSSRSPAAEG